MSGTRTEQESKHTPLDLSLYEKWAVEWRIRGSANGEAVGELIDDLVGELRRTRRLLEAGQRLAEAVHARIETCPSEVHPVVRGAHGDYEEAAK